MWADNPISRCRKADDNPIAKVAPEDKRWQYRLYGAGMLRRVVRPDGVQVTMTYDGLGRRVAKSFVPGGVGQGAGYVDRWVWDGNVMLHERSGGGLVGTSSAGASPASGQQPASGTEAANAQAASTATATAEPEADEVITAVGSADGELTTWVMEPETFRPLARLSRDSAHAIVTDHLGTPIRMYDRLGRESGTLDFTVYGKEWGEGLRGWMGCPFRYPGQYADAETGLYYNRFRYYDPEAGQYVSQDPIGLQGGNPTLYGYVKDVNGQYDPYGLAPCGRFPKSPDGIPAELPHLNLTRTNKPDRKVNFGFDHNGRDYRIEFHPKHGGLSTLMVTILT